MTDDTMDRGKALRDKYVAERERRKEHRIAHARLEGEYAHYLEDPWTERIVRDPVVEELEVVVVGGGFGGLLDAARLAEAGVDAVRIIDKAGDLGGTWYWNRYPGAACDTESYIYMPLLEETGYMPTRKYARAPELLEHSRRIGRHFGLYEKALLQTEITEMRWLDDRSRWELKTNRGDVLSARFVVLACGRLHRPQLPGIPGIHDFKGHSFHTSRWDYDYTGGDSLGGLVGLEDKRVGIIGTGATAVQVVPHLAAWAKELYVFQRTPPAVDLRNDRVTDPQWAASLKEGWQKERMDNFSAVISGEHVEKDLVDDGWTDLIVNVRRAALNKIDAGEKVDDPAAVVQEAEDQRMDRVRARIDNVIQDKATAEAMKPWYNQACKRACFHDDYLDAYNRPNVHLVDTQGLGVERITERGVVAMGKEYQLDCLIYSTGFEYNSLIPERMGFEVYGRNGLTLTEAWKDGAETMQGMLCRGFPNCFMITGIQSGYTANYQHMLDENSQHVAYIISEALARQSRELEPTPEAQQAWVDLAVKLATVRIPVLQECTPGFLNNEGHEIDETFCKNTQFWSGPAQFIQMLREWRADGNLPGLELTK